MGWPWGLLMLILLVAVAAALVWIAIGLSRRNAPPLQMAPPAQGTSMASPALSPPSAQDILAERLARGEIEPDDYRARLDALRSSSAG